MDATNSKSNYIIDSDNQNDLPSAEHLLDTIMAQEQAEDQNQVYDTDKKIYYYFGDLNYYLITVTRIDVIEMNGDIIYQSRKI